MPLRIIVIYDCVVQFRELILVRLENSFQFVFGCLSYSDIITLWLTNLFCTFVESASLLFQFKYSIMSLSTSIRFREEGNTIYLTATQGFTPALPRDRLQTALNLYYKAYITGSFPVIVTERRNTNTLNFISKVPTVPERRLI